MRCDEVQDLIQDFLVQDSGQLDEALRQHLDVCDGCRSRFESLAAVESLIQQAPLGDLPPGFDELFHRRLADCRGSSKADSASAFLLRPLISLATSGFSWVYWLMLSFGLVLGVRRFIPLEPYEPIEFSSSNLPALLAIMPLALVMAAAAAVLKGMPSTSRSEKQ